MIPFSNFIGSGPRAGVLNRPGVALRGGLRGACGDMAAVGEVLTTDPRTRDMAGGMKVVPTVWVQRAINALLSFESIPNAHALTVDGDAGPATLAAVKAVRLWALSRMGTIPSDPSYTAMPQILDHEHVAMAAHTHAAMNNVIRVADPVGSTVALCSWSRAAQIVPQAPTMTPDGVTLPSGSSSFVGEDYVVPVVAFLASAALGVLFVKLGAPKRGRR